MKTRHIFYVGMLVAMSSASCAQILDFEPDYNNSLEGKAALAGLAQPAVLVQAGSLARGAKGVVQAMAVGTLAVLAAALREWGEVAV